MDDITLQVEGSGRVACRECEGSMSGRVSTAWVWRLLGKNRTSLTSRFDNAYE